ncbi:MAG: hypothetical protein SFV21_17685 [Rhodospirillaceae bacterium]|nr:hypothetical protein [Rhodospirillaceae bacterium]
MKRVLVHLLIALVVNASLLGSIFVGSGFTEPDDICYPESHTEGEDASKRDIGGCQVNWMIALIYIVFGCLTILPFSAVSVELFALIARIAGRFSSYLVNRL